MKALAILGAFLAACFFLGCAVFSVNLHTDLIADGLFCIAIGLAISAAPVPE